MIASFRACERVNFRTLYIAKEHRRRGPGRRMLDACGDRGRSLGCSDPTLEVAGHKHVARGLDLPEGDVPDGAALHGKCPVDRVGPF